MKKNLFLLCFLSITISGVVAQDQNEEALFIRSIYDKALTQGQCYPWLHHLCKNIGNRISGSASAEKAVNWTANMLDTLGVDSVWLQPCMVPHWERGAKESARILGSKSMKNAALNILALGGSSAGKVEAEVVEVKSLDEVDKLGEAGIKGKIVFYNRPMDPTQIGTFSAYGGAVDQRVAGPARAAKYGAVAAIVRSMTTRLDDFPHTGTTVFTDVEAIPAVAISTNHAEMLSKMIKKEKLVKVFIKTDCRKLPDELSHNVIGEIRGSKFPDEFIVVGGHLDSWDVGEGAHDDGAGCMQSMDVLNVLKRANYRPQRTIRCVLFMNEENGLVGGRKYAEEVERKKEKHICAIESDGGGHTPRGMSFDGDESIFVPAFRKISKWSELLEPYGLVLKKGGSGSDISPLKKQKIMLCGLNADSQRYFDYHHTNNDTFEVVNQRELELGVAAMASMIYLLDKNGLSEK
ncbi:MAG: M20/M25/M40 family metallo-hydrolase [Saprospiraceae bacterium]